MLIYIPRTAFLTILAIGKYQKHCNIFALKLILCFLLFKCEDNNKQIHSFCVYGYKNLKIVKINKRNSVKIYTYTVHTYLEGKKIKNNPNHLWEYSSTIFLATFQIHFISCGYETALLTFQWHYFQRRNFCQLLQDCFEIVCETLIYFFIVTSLQDTESTYILCLQI